MENLEEQYLEKLNLEKQCLEKLNKILSKFNLHIVIIKVNGLNQRQYRLVYKNNTADWIALWSSMSDILFTRTTSLYKSIFERLALYHEVISNQSFNLLNMSKSKISRFQSCSDAYKEIVPLKSISLEEFLINCDLIGI